MTTTPTRTRAGFAEVALVVFGVYSVLVGLFMLVAPGVFFDTALSAPRGRPSPICAGDKVANAFATLLCYGAFRA